MDYVLMLFKDGFGFMISGIDLDDVGLDVLDNDSVKFIVFYGVDFEL